MKKFFTLFLLFIGLTVFSQSDDNPIVVTPTVEKISDTEYDLIFDIEIAEDWHLYSQYNPEDASLPMSISPAEGQTGYTLNGKAKEGDTETEFSEIWGKDEIFFVDEGRLVQRITVSDASLTQITLNLDAQVCKEYCLPFDEDFTFSLIGEEVVQTVVEVDDKSQSLAQSLNLNLKNTALLKSTTQKSSEEDGDSLLNIFLLGFVGGLLAFLTPCVFPMVPLTVSYFTKHNEKKGKGIRSAILYGFFIVLIYGLLSLPFHYLDTLDPEILNSISTNMWLNLFFFTVLIFFAGSFFGFYELTLPSSWSNKADSASSIGGIIGIFFMALTLAIVSFSCTGPILGSLLAGSLGSDGGAMQLSAGMIGFGAALALPFALFAMFPKWLNSLPKSGGWLNTVKVFLGFLELAFAFKFLSNADLVGHWDLLKREVFIGIWAFISLLTALYLFGFIGKKYGKITFFRVLLGMGSLALAIYLAPGVMEKPVWNQNALLSGFAPPQFHSIYKKDNKCPLGLNCFKDFEEGIAYAKSVNKPVLLDFTGWACVNCRKMEENIWVKPEIYSLISDDYVLISLYVDDHERQLPEEEQFDFIKPNGKVKRIRTYGDKWATLQVANFKTASQPFYILMSPNLELLNSPQQYTDHTSYYNWLKTGLDNFNNN
ncbi:cytochrome c biogenesis protein CcdA [Tenacibaculum sp. HL-MS23]|uniref:protein-disulfide reductase DsbD family protein n=1 Tax=Tenacibaculum TaxID=104267 RepID=UPI001C4E654E|nr:MULTISPECIES: cytochrome c biogenesis protein CcdA [Tenacibaculum]QXP73425.1 thioredoxin family protein [Tenacibaculum sp. AHE14PA]QXP74939.1 thioredoxin family protein [Tenacibaculum sp. AHE15PA]WNW01478.1 cytochrome c biogenesis protein CcdA [Tenacibaculum sp. HL-MS23]